MREMASANDSTPSETPQTVFEAVLELNSGGNSMPESVTVTETMAEMPTESAQNISPLAPAAEAIGENEARGLRKRVSTVQEHSNGLELVKTPKILA